MNRSQKKAYALSRPQFGWRVSAWLLTLFLLLTMAGPVVPVRAEIIQKTLHGSYDYDMAQAVFQMTNQERVSHGLEPLIYDYASQDFAMLRAAEASVFFSHSRPDGSPTSSSYGENIEKGAQSAALAMDHWMHSDGHRANILKADYTAMAVGCFIAEDGSVTWSQLFSFKTAAEAAGPEPQGRVACSPTFPMDSLYDNRYSGDVMYLKPGDTFKLEITVTVNGQIYNGRITWKSSNPAVATVDGMELHAHSDGVAYVSIVNPAEVGMKPLKVIVGDGGNGDAGEAPAPETTPETTPEPTAAPTTTPAPTTAAPTTTPAPTVVSTQPPTAAPSVKANTAAGRSTEEQVQATTADSTAETTPAPIAATSRSFPQAQLRRTADSPAKAPQSSLTTVPQKTLEAKVDQEDGPKKWIWILLPVAGVMALGGALIVLRRRL